MVKAKLMQIRMTDRAMVFMFENDNGQEIGSRGVNLDEKTFNEVATSMTIVEFFKLKQSGLMLPDTPATKIEEIAVCAYQEFLAAKKVEEEKSVGVIE